MSVRGESFDVVIAGSGPAGAVAATVLARGGARVLLVDPGRFPRDKACGDIVGPRGVKVLDELAVLPADDGPAADVVLVGLGGSRDARLLDLQHLGERDGAVGGHSVALEIRQPRRELAQHRPDGADGVIGPRRVRGKLSSWGDQSPAPCCQRIALVSPSNALPTDVKAYRAGSRPGSS